MVFGVWPPREYTNAEWAGIRTLILLTAGGAWWQASEARKLRLERSRPFVVLDLDIHQTITDFEITNIRTHDGHGERVPHVGSRRTRASRGTWMVGRSRPRARVRR